MQLYKDYEYASVSMSSDADFIKALEALFRQHTITHILESGTFEGLGSTTLLAETVLKSKKIPVAFYTLEVDARLYKKAVKNLLKYPFITPLWGLSVSSEAAISFIKTDDAIRNHHQYSDVFIDDVADPVQFYLDEVAGQLSNRYYNRNAVQQLWDRLFPTNRLLFEENLFGKLVPQIRHTQPLILLDSADGLGYLEFKTICTLMAENPFLLILDDVHHLKHFRSYIDIQASPDFTLLAENKKHGWIIARHL